RAASFFSAAYAAAYYPGSWIELVRTKATWELFSDPAWWAANLTEPRPPNRLCGGLRLEDQRAASFFSAACAAAYYPGSWIELVRTKATWELFFGPGMVGGEPDGTPPTQRR
ncbi:hypothetical protein, partial [Roseicyclus marinus]|uniref:hypothetical protein n=1 Tax=Roseicyclus marinus TaxID=2161673 RepID=UPI0036176636